MDVMRRAWSTLSIKSFDEEARTFTGMATTPSTDRMGDIVEPKGANFKLPISFLYQHDAKRPIGQITKAKVTDAGIEVSGYVERLDGPPTLKERLDVAWAEMKSGLVRGLSIGFTGEGEPIKGTYGLRFSKWDWLELSAVTIPANAEASITAIKSADALLLAASGQREKGVGSIVSIKPGATGPQQIKGNGMKTQEMISGLESKRSALVAAMETLVEASNAEGSTFTPEQKEAYGEHRGQVTAIDDQLVVLRDHEKLMLKGAAPVIPAAGAPAELPAAGRVALGEGVIKVNKELPKGIGMARYVKALAFSRGNYQQAQEYAKQWDTSTPEVGLALKTAISAGTTTDSVWAGPLVYAQDFPAAFLDFLRPQTIIGKLTGISHVPFNIRYGIQDGGSTVAWVGQGAPKPVSKLHFTSGSLGFAKAAGIVVITQELARFSSPSAELKVRDDLTAQMVQFLDQQFIDPSVAAVANISPASVLNGATNVRQAAAAWTTMAAVITDVKALMATFAANEISLQGGYWVMTPDTALTLSLLLNTGGTAFAFPDITINGGTFLGLPVVVSNSVPHSVSAGAIVALIVPKHIYLADEGGIAVDSSQEASLQMEDAAGATNNSATPTATTLVSMFQTNSIAVRVERVINWSRARTYGVGYIDNMHTS